MLMLAKDMTAGVQLAVELIERATVDENDAYMTGYHRGVLMRFAIASCSLFHGAVEEHLDSIRDDASKEGK
ncbi:MAG: hypothetical protein JWQ23_4623 [Herminiimonas sp.]|nr:hypothetical protein [Herminiimonas sp.]